MRCCQKTSCCRPWVLGFRHAAEFRTIERERAGLALERWLGCLSPPDTGAAMDRQLTTIFEELTIRPVHEVSACRQRTDLISRWFC